MTEGVTFEVWGIGGAVAVALVMTLLKKLFPELKDRAALAVTLGVGLVLAGAVYLSGVYPDVQTALGVVGQGILAALSAMGVYSTTKHVRGDF